ncbi:kinase-like domain-containing protein [Trichoderma novae-zelandiae]
MPTTHHCQCCNTNGFCKDHQVQCNAHPKVFYYQQDSTGYPKNQQDPKPQSLELDSSEAAIFRSVKLLAQGGYNVVWLVRLHSFFEVTTSVTDGQGNPQSTTRSFNEYVLRLPCGDALLPYQITNDVAFKKFITTKLPHVPVPLGFFYHATQEHSTSFIAEEYIDATPLSSNWMSLKPEQKESMAKQLAKITVDLADTHFAMIGGLNPNDFQPGPTVEGAKIFKGRYKFHSKRYYPIGPYRTTKEYILACYDREIAYYSHADEEDIEKSLFQKVRDSDFIGQLNKKRDVLASTDMADEPFTLVHGDFHGRNILTKGDQILGILDWEFAGSYPVSETLSGGGIDVVDADSEELDEENTLWDRRIRGFIHEEAGARRWKGGKLDLLLGDGNLELARARVEMFP